MCHPQVAEKILKLRTCCCTATLFVKLRSWLQKGVPSSCENIIVDTQKKLRVLILDIPDVLGIYKNILSLPEEYEWLG